MWVARILSLGWENLLEKEMATHSSILVWRILWTEEPGRLQSMGSQRVRHDWATSLSLSDILLTSPLPHSSLSHLLHLYVKWESGRLPSSAILSKGSLDWILRAWNMLWRVSRDNNDLQVLLNSYYTMIPFFITFIGFLQRVWLLTVADFQFHQK